MAQSMAQRTTAYAGPGIEPVLAVDLGTDSTAAALLTSDQWRLVSDPETGARTWPAPAGTGPAPVSQLLRAIKEAAQRRFGIRLTRLAAAVSPDPEVGVGERELLAAGQDASFDDVDLVPSHVAAVLDPASGPSYQDGATVLVCDLGATWSVALVRVNGDRSGLSGHACGPGTADLAGALRWVVDSSRKLAADAGAELAAAVISGGWAQHRGVIDHLQRALALPTRPAVEPELAGVRGVVRWAASTGRRIPADPPRWRVEPMSWRIPGGQARVVRWLVEPNSPYPAGAGLARVRTADDRVFDLTATSDGVLLGHPVPAGAPVRGALLAPVAPAVGTAVYHPPPHRHRWSASGGWLLTPRLLVEWDATGRYVQTRDLRDGAVAGVFQPDLGGYSPHSALVRVDPDGKFCLLAWDANGEFAVWDIAGASLRTRFRGPAGASRILVNEGRWRLAAEVPDSVSVGRYRRTAVTFWDLATGRRLDKVVADDWRRRYPGYADRSGADRFVTEAASPDLRLRALATDRTVTVSETGTDREVFSSTHESPCHARTAFSADGRFLLALWQADDRSTVDVWSL